MSSKVAHYLQEHLVGEVIDSSDARRYFSTDNSIFQIPPSLIVYPRNENDIRKTARFTWQLAERGRLIPLTPRGAGTDETGAAIGTGIIIAFTAHMNRILELNTKSKTVTVEPGINYGKLQQVLHTHGAFLPPYPPELDYSTIGGAIGNNASGEKSFKYGSTRGFIKALRVVLANGEVIETKRLTKRELSKKLGLATFEGEIYRSIDTMIEENHQVIEQFHLPTSLNNAGYGLYHVKQKDGSFDLSPLIAGSQGTLGIVSEVTLDIEDYNPVSTLVMAEFDSVEKLQQALISLNESKELPSSIELVDQSALVEIIRLNPNHLKGLVNSPLPRFLAFFEFENTKKPPKSATKVLDSLAKGYDISSDPEEQIRFRRIREAVNVISAHNEGLLRPLPLFDGAVPLDRVRDYLEGLHKLIKNNTLNCALWGHIGEGNLVIKPRLNLGHVGDRQKIFRILDEYYRLVISLNGTISATSGDGRLRTPYLETMYSPEAYALLVKTKQIFDPYGTLNPGIKFSTTNEDLKTIIRPDYSLSHIYDHLPRS
ncbi:MAG TPA: FAD-binding oxidoreductase [Candidatus Saccharimonadales bacterium]|nr:FAD-binding oxidoreductase [Candidatus Saccharimonadales bacterium]